MLPIWIYFSRIISCIYQEQVSLHMCMHAYLFCRHMWFLLWYISLYSKLTLTNGLVYLYVHEFLGDVPTSIARRYPTTRWSSPHRIYWLWMYKHQQTVPMWKMNNTILDSTLCDVLCGFDVYIEHGFPPIGKVSYPILQDKPDICIWTWPLLTGR